MNIQYDSNCVRNHVFHKNHIQLTCAHIHPGEFYWQLPLDGSLSFSLVPKVSMVEMCFTFKTYILFFKNSSTLCYIFAFFYVFTSVDVGVESGE